jgi:hypothetical protein
MKKQKEKRITNDLNGHKETILRHKIAILDKEIAKNENEENEETELSESELSEYYEGLQKEIDSLNLSNPQN